MYHRVVTLIRLYSSIKVQPNLLQQERLSLRLVYMLGISSDNAMDLQWPLLSVQRWFPPPSVYPHTRALQLSSPRRSFHLLGCWQLLRSLLMSKGALG